MYTSRPSSSFEALIATGVIKWEITTDIGTKTKERGSASQWKAPPLTHKTRGICHMKRQDEKYGPPEHEYEI
jgi:hypothetical protein